MSLTHPGLLAIAAILAAVGLWRLLRPPRLRVVVSHRQLWQQALAQVRRQRAWRMPALWMVLLAAGGLALAASVGGAVWKSRRPAAAPVLVLVADTPHIAVTIAQHPEKTRLLVRLDELMARLDGRTPVRLVVLGATVEVRNLAAGDWKKLRADFERSLTMTGPTPNAVDAERDCRRPGDEMVYLLGEFSAVPPGRSDVQWIIRPKPPTDDLGIAAAGAVLTGEGGEVFVEVRPYAGAGGPVRVVVSFAGKDEKASDPLDLAGQSTRRAILPMPPDFAGPITIRLDRSDDQPLNNAFYLAPPATGNTATFELVGRPNEWIVRAGQAGRMRQRRVGEPSADWLIVNEPADPVGASPGQGLVAIDPLTMPAGVRLVGELSEAKIVSHSSSVPWGQIPLDGLSIRRAGQVVLDPRWSAVAADEAGRPLIAYNSTDRQLAVFFSVAAGNTDWFSRKSWPLFWNALADLAGGGRTTSAEGIRWSWQAGSRPGLAGEPAVATNLPPGEFDPPPAARAIDKTIRLPSESEGETNVPAWAMLAAGATVLLLAGWLLNAGPWIASGKFAASL